VAASDTNVRRLVVKLGSNLLADDRGDLSRMAMRRLVDQLADLHRSGIEVAVVSSGAVAAARGRFSDLRDRPDLPAKQVLAAIGQVRLMQLYDRFFNDHGIPVAQALLAPGDLGRRRGYLNARSTLLGLLRNRIMPIINENDVVATDELKFGDNDTLSAVVAGLIDADLLLILTDIAGLFTADPRRDPAATLIREVPKLTARVERLAGGSGSTHGTGGMVTKLRAARLATSAGIPSVIADGRVDGAIRQALAGGIGTRFQAAGDRLDARRRWLRAHVGGRGAVVVDDGASRALRYLGRSLLPVGVVHVLGKFEQGDSVEVRDRRGHIVAYGLSNYSSLDAHRIMRSHSECIRTILGYSHGDEVIHRDNLVVVAADPDDMAAEVDSSGYSTEVAL
jgi:glutamate 5-kinase